MPVTVTVAMSMTVTLTIYEVDDVAVAVAEAMYKVADDVPSVVSGLRGRSHGRQRKHDDDGTGEDGFHALFSFVFD
ncbi:MAG: hypothetical protein K8F92_08685 [Hyphomicrobium sp.]|uniref:hypothetical protein n=1 Tax=Hyphomicrobium sp. TaxID=82 RepID=UPI0025BFD7FE|nr:hypothetical protein [Hyphomicrobium sp.]MBZ0209718.1 hypothetical protein [Hyphomicrobium sp.]